jgi:hypothetical protein
MSLISHILQQIDDEEKQVGENQCFIGHEFRHRDLRIELEHALSSLSGTKLQPYFADSEVTGGFVLEKICKKILATRATIVDLTTANPNVYFELGLAIGLNKPIFVVLKQQKVVPTILESFVKLHFTSYTELEEHLVIQVPSWLEQSIEHHMRYNSHCHFVNVRCPDRQRITPKRRYLLIDHLKVTDEATQSAYDRDLQQELLAALARFHFEPTSLYKIPLESSFRLCDYCRNLRDSSFAFCHLTRQSSLDVYFLLGLATGLDIPSLLIVQKERDDSPPKPFEIPSMLKGLDLFEYKHYDEIGERLGDEVESFLNAKKYQPIAGRILTFLEARRREGEHEDQTEREPGETPQTEVQTAVQQRLLEIKSISDAQERLSMLIQLSQELADQGDAAGLRETLLIVRSFTHSAQQVGMLVAIVEAFASVRDTEGIRRVLEMVLGEERDEVRDPLLEAIALAYERLNEHDKAMEVAFLQSGKVSSAGAGMYVNEAPLKVFISYSHDSLEHDDRVLAFSDRLRADGIDCNLDQYAVSPAEGWPRWMDRQIHEADFVLMVCTPTYFRRVMGEEELDTGYGVMWESQIIYQYIYNQGTINTKFIPVLLEGANISDIPTPLKSAMYYHLSTDTGYEELYRRLTHQPRTLKPLPGKLKQLPSRDHKHSFSREVQNEQRIVEVTDNSVSNLSDNSQIVEDPADLRRDLDFSTQFQPASDDFPVHEKQKLLDYRNMIQNIRNEITPDKDLLQIDEAILQIFLQDLRSISSGLSQTRNSNISLIVDGVNRIYALLTKAINQLNVARLILKEIEKIGFDRQIRIEYFECLNECESYLAEILQEFEDMLL